MTGGVNDHCENALELNPDGTVSVYNTWDDQGQGADIGTLVHAHECLRPLGLKPEQIILIQADTGICPISGPAGASRSHYMNGNAIATPPTSCSTPCASRREPTAPTTRW